MPVYSNILVAIDCSPADNSVISHVSALALELGSTVHLLHIIHSHTLDQERDLRARATETLEQYSSALKAEGLEVRIIIRSGEPEKEIIRETGENSYDLLAMATHGHNLPERIIFGSVTRALRDKTTIPLLLVRQDKQS